jgi:hypothetical protein
MNSAICSNRRSDEPAESVDSRKARLTVCVCRESLPILGIDLPKLFVDQFLNPDVLFVQRGESAKAPHPGFVRPLTNIQLLPHRSLNKAAQ